MKMIRAVVLLWVLGGLAASIVRAQDAPAAGDGAKADCRSSDLVLQPASPASAAHQVGQTLRITASGGCASRVKDQVAKNPAAPALTLLLDDVEMKGVKPARPQAGSGGAIVVPFELTRNSLDDDNRKSWDTLFFKQPVGYTMKMTVALMIGTEPAVLVADRNAFALEVSDPDRIGIVLVGSLVVFSVAFVLLVRSTNALRDSRDGPFSLGRSQMAFWGLLVLLSFLGIFLVSGTMERLPKEVLVLLGISGTTGLSAVLIDAGKKPLRDQQAELVAAQAAGALSAVDTATLDKLNKQIADAENAAQKAKDNQKGSVVPVMRKFFTDICDDGNGLSFHRMQVVFWTLVLGGVFVWSVSKTMTMPTFQDTLLLLMGISNGTYLGFKFPEKT